MIEKRATLRLPVNGEEIAVPAAAHLLGANTVSRWESGRNVQSAAMDMLLRLIRDVPGSIPYLRDRAA